MGARSGQSGGSSPFSEVSFVRGFGMGLLPFVLSFVVCSVLLAVEIGSTEAGFRFLEFYGSEAWKLLALMFSAAFWSAHPGALENSSQFLQGLDTVPEFGYIAVVVGLLTFYGYRSVSGANRSYSDAGAALQGATIAIAYALLLVVSWFALSSILEGQFQMNAELARLVGVAGVGYPLVFGAIGGFLASQRGGSASRSAGGAPPRQPQQQPRGQQRRGQQPQGQHVQDPQPQGQPGQQAQGRPPQGQPAQAQNRQPQGRPSADQQSRDQPPVGQAEQDQQAEGRSREQPDGDSAPSGSNCSNCGAVVEAGSTSCPNCGSML